MKDLYNMLVVLLLLAIFGVQMYSIVKKKESWKPGVYYPPSTNYDTDTDDDEPGDSMGE